MVSSFFGYTEEYVMDHTLSWLSRKYQQAIKQQFEDSSLKVMEGYKSLLLLIDSAFNKGKDFNKILPPSYEDVVKEQMDKLKENDQFVSGQWWKKTTENAKESFK